jgi:hypothetical protein
VAPPRIPGGSRWAPAPSQPAHSHPVPHPGSSSAAPPYLLQPPQPPAGAPIAIVPVERAHLRRGPVSSGRSDAERPINGVCGPPRWALDARRALIAAQGPHCRTGPSSAHRAFIGARGPHRRTGPSSAHGALIGARGPHRRTGPSLAYRCPSSREGPGPSIAPDPSEREAPARATASRAMRGQSCTTTCAPEGRISKSRSTSSLYMRTHPSLAAPPMLSGSQVPWKP